MCVDEDFVHGCSRAIRGPTQVDCNSREDILGASAELVAEVIRCRVSTLYQFLASQGHVLLPGRRTQIDRWSPTTQDGLVARSGHLPFELHLADFAGEQFL